MRIGVVGLGKLGLPLLAVLGKSGHQVWGFDVSEERRRLIENSESNFSEPDLACFLEQAKKNIKIVQEILPLVENCELICIIVPTPSDEHGKFSNTFLESVCEEIGRAYSNFSHELTVNIVSTVMPQSCEKVLQPILESSSGKKFGSSFGITYNPEFIALGSVIKNMQYPDMQLLGASSKLHADRVMKMLQSITLTPAPVRIMSLAEAELVKISVNNFVTFKIAFANMLGELAEGIGQINIDKVTEAIGLDSRIGNKYLKFGTPYGGPCFPRDTRALATLLKEYGKSTSLPQTVDTLNSEFFDFLVNKVRNNITPSSRIGILGISYKAFSDVIEESTGVRLLKDLYHEGYSVRAWDPLVSSLEIAPKKEVTISQDLVEIVQFSEVLVITRGLSEISLTDLHQVAGDKFIIDFWRNVK